MSPQGRKNRTGMDAARIVRAALALTRSHGLAGWTLRDLTATLDTSPSVVFYHVGDRAALSSAVVSRLTESFSAASPDLAWQDWVRQTARPLRGQLAAWPGVADWLLVHGPVFPHMMHILDDGIAVLRRDGFGDEAATAYATLYTALIGSIAQSQNRSSALVDGVDPHTAMRAHLREVPSLGPGAASMLELLDPYLQPGPEAERARDEAYCYLLDRLIDGLTARLSVIEYLRETTA